MEKFVVCMKEITDKTEKREKEFSYYISNMNQDMVKCLENAGESEKAFSQCQLTYKPKIEKYVNDFFKNL